MLNKKGPAKISSEDKVVKSAIVQDPDVVKQPAGDNTNPKQLEFMKRKLIELGMPAESVDAFTTPEQCQAVIDTLKAKNVIQRVATLEETPNPREDRQIERQWQSKKDIMMDKWLKEEAEGKTVQFLVPLEPNERAGVVTWTRDKSGRKEQSVKEGTAVELIQENGARWYVPKGRLVFVPQSVGNSLARRLRLTNEAGQEFLIDRTDPETGKTVGDSL